jgi:hypothetical protein
MQKLLHITFGKSDAEPKQLLEPHYLGGAEIVGTRSGSSTEVQNKQIFKNFTNFANISPTVYYFFYHSNFQHFKSHTRSLKSFTLMLTFVCHKNFGLLFSSVAVGAA